MKRVPWAILLAPLVCVICACGQQKPAEPSPPVEAMREVGRTPLAPWPEAASVRLFIRAEGGVNDAYLESDGRLLSPDERRRIDRSFSVIGFDREPEAVAACFVPHHWLRYYDVAGRMIGELAVCFCCAGVQETPALRRDVPGAYREITFGSLKAIIEGMGLPTAINCGEP
jgi:hypothetical protein